MKAKVWVNVRVYMHIEAVDENEIRKEAVKRITNVGTDQMIAGLKQAKEIGSAYPQDIVEIDEIL